MKVLEFGHGEPKSLVEFCEKHALGLEVKERSSQSGLPRYYATLTEADVKQSSTLVGVYGNGGDAEEALQELVRALRGQRVVVGAGSPGRREIDVPNELAYEAPEREEAIAAFVEGDGLYSEDKPYKRNAARCLRCQTVAESRSRHERRSCECGMVTVDGGLDYLKRLGGPFEELSISADEAPVEQSGAAEERLRQAEEAATLKATLVAAAYVTDRAQQYQTRSGCHDALMVVAEDIRNGEPQRAYAHCELDDLVRMHQSWRTVLERVKRRAMEQAWTEGFKAGRLDASKGEHDNPYRRPT